MPKTEVAVLDLKRHELRTLNREQASRGTGEKHETVTLPRWKRSTEVYLSEDGKSSREYVATVHMWRLGLGYNVHRMFGNTKKLYVLTN
ncbi:hypothetical protein GQ53DRAFT_744905 [Thozetella sp. PMI_491]|nr:hypothetical protein GQ53DRAFT_744905 [Thozetella sp. PMI_491]